MTIYNDEAARFLPKRYGYGAGLPIRWRGWVLLGSYLLMTICAIPFFERSPAAFAVILFVATVAFLTGCATRTRGGWPRRWGDGG